jgi:phytoene dehydrogenase-like protein
MFYGNYLENDMELAQFIIMFRSIFMEGLWRPANGIKVIIKLLEDKLNSENCEIRKKTHVKKVVHGNGMLEILLSDEGKIFAKKIISSIGANETLRLCQPPVADTGPNGTLSFIEAVFCLSKKPDLGLYNNACLFYNENEYFKYKKVSCPFALESGVIACPDNFKYKSEQEMPPLTFLRLTSLADGEWWINADARSYEEKKKEFRAEAFAKIRKKTGIKNSEDDILFCEIFTPRTILRWSGHLNGAIYGSGKKNKSGLTDIKNLFICGTDQGFLGIIGSILSGISIANLRGLNSG